MKKIKYSEKEQLNLKLFLILNRCGLSVNKNIYPIFKKENITESQFYVLELLYHKGDMKIKEILEKTFSTGGTMTVIIENLLKEELIFKKQNPLDRRSSLISITEKGYEIVEKVFSNHIENLDKVLGVLTSKEKNELIDLLKKLGKAQ
ncbi:MAG: MarR family transcriptional regulator [Fusobacteriaceae bacterium]|jgi:MarR family 2-MHQ and catechol resistance regulon transcriptional repressor|nr:MarR family transcriptional regulator [Fusobacteriaceae bacterium]